MSAKIEWTCDDCATRAVTDVKLSYGCISGYINSPIGWSGFDNSGVFCKTCTETRWKKLRADNPDAVFVS